MNTDAEPNTDNPMPDKQVPTPPMTAGATATESAPATTFNPELDRVALVAVPAQSPPATPNAPEASRGGKKYVPKLSGESFESATKSLGPIYTWNGKQLTADEVFESATKSLAKIRTWIAEPKHHFSPEQWTDLENTILEMQSSVRTKLGIAPSSPEIVPPRVYQSPPAESRAKEVKSPESDDRGGIRDERRPPPADDDEPPPRPASALPSWIAAGCALLALVAAVGLAALVALKPGEKAPTAAKALTKAELDEALTAAGTKREDDPKLKKAREELEAGGLAARTAADKLIATNNELKGQTLPTAADLKPLVQAAVNDFLAKDLTIKTTSANAVLAGVSDPKVAKALEAVLGTAVASADFKAKWTTATDQMATSLAAAVAEKIKKDIAGLTVAPVAGVAGDPLDVLVIATHSQRLSFQQIKKAFQGALVGTSRNPPDPFRVALCTAYGASLQPRVEFGKPYTEQAFAVTDDANGTTEELKLIGERFTGPGLFDLQRPNRRVVLVASASAKPPPPKAPGWTTLRGVDVILVRPDATDPAAANLTEWLAFLASTRGRLVVLTAGDSGSGRAKIDEELQACLRDCFDELKTGKAGR